MHKKERPRINKPWTGAELSLEFLAVAGIVAIIGLCGYFWNELPDRIPIHFNLKGDPDGWGAKIHLLWIPALTLVFYSGLTVLSRYPHIYNYPFAITPENAARQYGLARTLVIIMKTYVIGLFTAILWQQCLAAVGASSGLSPYLIPVLLILPLAAVSAYLTQAYRYR